MRIGAVLLFPNVRFAVARFAMVTDAQGHTIFLSSFFPITANPFFIKGVSNQCWGKYQNGGAGAAVFKPAAAAPFKPAPFFTYFGGFPQIFSRSLRIYVQNGPFFGSVQNGGGYGGVPPTLPPGSFFVVTSGVVFCGTPGVVFCGIPGGVFFCGTSGVFFL